MSTRLEWFRFLRRVEEVDVANGTIRCVAELASDNPIFDEHFPGLPVVPGVLLIEMMAHAAGFLVMRRQDCAKLPVLAGVDRARFRSLVHPGVPLLVSARLEHEGSGLSGFDAEVLIDEARAASAHVRLAFREFPDEAAKAFFAERARELGLFSETA